MVFRLLPLLLLLAGCTSEIVAPSYFELRMTNVSPEDGVMGEMGMYAPRFSPGWVRVGDPLFAEGEAASSALAFLAENGDPTGLASSGGSSIPEEFEDSYEGSPLTTGVTFRVRFEATPGQRLNFASMFIESNDIIVGADDVPLFDGEAPLSGDITSGFSYFDVGSEVNEPPGFGPGQPAGTVSGEDEAGVVTRFAEMDAAGHRYAPLDSVVRFELLVCDTPEC